MKKIVTELRSSAYQISVAAKLTGLHVQTLRYYERTGIIEPSRSKGNIRLYSDADIKKIRRIKSLIDDLGVNLAGVEVILRMSERMVEMESALQQMEAAMPVRKPGSARVARQKIGSRTNAKTR